MADSCSAVPALAPPVWRSGTDGLLHLGIDAVFEDAGVASPLSCAGSGRGGGCSGSGFCGFLPIWRSFSFRQRCAVGERCPHTLYGAE